MTENLPAVAKATRNDLTSLLEAAAKPDAPLPNTRGRLLFALDATGSRQPTWTAAKALQAEMFSEAARVGALDLQLAWFRGSGTLLEYGPWVADSATLRAQMERIDCRSGATQIELVLRHALRTAALVPLNAFVFIGDAFEESRDALLRDARALGAARIPGFFFQEGDDRETADVFKVFAGATGGAFATFSPDSLGVLRDLLRAVGAFATGGTKALAASPNAAARLLLTQIRKDAP